MVIHLKNDCDSVRKLCETRCLVSVPTNRFSKSPFKAHPGAEAKLFLSPGDIQAPSGLTVGLGGIPDYFSLETGLFGDKLNQIFNADFKPGAYIHGIRFVVFLGREQDGFGGVFHVEELPGRLSGSPYQDLAFPFLNGFDAFPDQGGDDMGRVQVKVVSWPV